MLCPPPAATVSPLGHFLAADVGEIDLVGRQGAEQLVEPRRLGLDLDFAGEEGHGLGQAGDGDDLDALDDRRFGRAGRGNEHAVQARILGGGDRHRERAAGRAGGAVEGQFAHHGIFGQPLRGDLPAAGQNADGHGQIERGGVFGQLGRGQIDHHAVLRAAGSPS